MLTPELAVALILLIPFAAGLVAPFLRRSVPVVAGWLLALAPAAAFLLLWRFIPELAAGRDIAVAYAWGGAHGLALSFRIDGLSLVFALAVSGIGALVLVYSGAYLKGHAHQGRFLAFLLFFTAAMLGLVFADSTIALYAFWELTTVTSFLLIGFDHSRQLARRAAIQAVVVTTAGGLALLVAAILLERITGSWELSAIAGPLADHPAYAVVLACVLFAAFTKSAQVPFHFWLPSAMEAPTPVSAFLHSAAMVQGGIYLLARLSPALGGTVLWTGALLVFGGVTLLWGGVQALRQTDLKQLLAHTTIASLGLLVLLLGIGTEFAVAGVIVYFVAHALYKAALFLVVGSIEHETGTRELTALGGLRTPMALTFIVAVLAAASMLGLPPLLGFFAKEELYAAFVGRNWTSLGVLFVVVAGNALIGAAALTLALRPFVGTYVRPPKEPRDPAFAMLLGPLVFGIVGAVAAFAGGWVAEALLNPAAGAVRAGPATVHLGPGLDVFGLAFGLSLVTWILSGLLYWQLDRVRTLLRRADSGAGWSMDRAFDVGMFGLIRFAGGVTRLLHHGRLELYLVVVFAALAVALIAPLWWLGGIPALPRLPQLTFYEWAILGLALAGVVVVVVARTRLLAILALGVQGLAVALIYLLAGAPDLSFTQLMVEVLSVVILALVMTRLKLVQRDPRVFEDFTRDGGIALVCGLGSVMLLFAVLDNAVDTRLRDFFDQASESLAHGHNIVNVILVDFRGLDTLGEITVVMTAGIAVLALLRAVRRREEQHS